MNALSKYRKLIDRIDKRSVRLFEKRMIAVREIARIKALSNAPVEDKQRESQVIERRLSVIKDENILPYYLQIAEKEIQVSKQYQNDVLGALTVNTAQGICEVAIGPLETGLKKLNLKRKALVVTDDGVPQEYAKRVIAACKYARLLTLKSGESTKSLDGYVKVLNCLEENGFTRKDCVISVGGGVVSDLAGFAAATYMRGIDHYIVPTTLLAQVDAAIGGKTAINFDGKKNHIGAFWQPKAVVVDVSLLETLDKMNMSNGFAEVIKIAAVTDKEFFEYLETADKIDCNYVVRRSIELKKRIVEQDERDNGKRMLLNFGHTFAHAIELNGELMHGQCVAVGMLMMSAEKPRARLFALLKKFGALPDKMPDMRDTAEKTVYDKKASGDGRIKCVYLNDIGRAEIKEIDLSELKENELLLHW